MRTTTMVTALFDIGRQDWKYYNLSRSMYLYWYKNTLSVDANHVIYTDGVYYDEVVKIVKQHGTSNNIKIYKKRLEELPSYIKYYDRMSEMMSSVEFKKKINFNVPEMLYPLYNTIVFNKVFFLQDALEKNPFDSDIFIWADAGGLRGGKDENYNGKIWPNQNKINELKSDKITTFSHTNKISVPDKEFHVLSQIRFIQGGSFFVPIDLIGPLVETFDKNVIECLNLGYIGSDEKLLDLCYLDMPDLFDLKVCTWREYYNLYS
jgi:protein YibB